ncbi:MAG TPA: carbohydrate kinase family protein [Spirochaetia bacterium]|nr:carbohydrate kinase family protein [Spirochaetia bacterium]
MAKDVLFVGDINVDLMLGGLEMPPAIDREVTCASFALTMGSSIVITAANYSGLGGSAAVAGLVGDDDYGRFMIAGMNERSIDTSLVQTSHAVGTGVTVNLIYRETRTQITYPGTIATFEDISEIESRIGEYSHIHFSGVYQQHKFRPKIEGLLKLARASGATASLDPQWDPLEKWEFLETWLPYLEYFFVNEDEAISFTREREPDQAIARLSGMTQRPICKIGARGAILPVNGDTVIIPTYEVPIHDTTGAGDAFAAGVLYARLEKGMGLAESVRFANAVAARNCTEEGGVNSCPTFDEINHFMETRGE